MSLWWLPHGMGLAVKTDGAAVASGAITEALIYGDAATRGVIYDKGWMIGVTTTVKIFIDIFIGVWAFLLAYVWTRHMRPRRWVAGCGDLGALPEIRPWLHRHLPDRFPHCACLKCLFEAPERWDERGQCISADILSPDFLCDRIDGRCEKAMAAERTPPELRAASSKLFGIQSWVALSAKDEETEPDFIHYKANDLPDLNGEGRVIAGSVLGASSPVRTSSPMFYADVRLSPGVFAT
jgi:hypothetical protein